MLPWPGSHNPGITVTETGPNTDGVAAHHAQTASAASGQAGTGDHAGESASRRDLTWLWIVLLTALAACLRFAGIGHAAPLG